MMKKYNDFLIESKGYKLTIKDSQELNDFLIHVVEHMDNEPNLLRSAYTRIQKILSEIRKGNFTKSALSFLFSSIFYFIEGNRKMDELRAWSEKLLSIDIDEYDNLLLIIDQYNQLLNKNKDKFDNQIFNIKSWAFEREGIRELTESYNDYCDFGCGYISTYLENNPDIDEHEFGEYVTQHNKADRDMGELQDISKDEIERLGNDFLNEAYGQKLMGLKELAEMGSRTGNDEKVLLQILIQEFKKGGDESVKKIFKSMTDLDIDNIIKGKYVLVY